MLSYLPPTRTEERESLLRRMIQLKRLVDERIVALLLADPVELEDGRPVWLEEEEFVEEQSKLYRIDRIVLSLHRLLGSSSSIVADAVTLHGPATFLEPTAAA